MTKTITDPAQALALAELVELQAAWENAPKAVGPDTSRKDLLAKQKAFEAYWSKTNEFNRQYRPPYTTERQVCTHHWLAVWCRDMQHLFAAAGAARCPVQVVEKAHRWAERVAGKAEQEALTRTVPATTADAVRTLEAIAQWCEGVPPAAG